jgi:transposase
LWPINEKKWLANQKPKVLTKEQELARENKELKEELFMLKKWQWFLAEEHQADIDSSKNSALT